MNTKAIKGWNYPGNRALRRIRKFTGRINQEDEKTDGDCIDQNLSYPSLSRWVDIIRGENVLITHVQKS